MPKKRQPRQRASLGTPRRAAASPRAVSRKGRRAGARASRTIEASLQRTAALPGIFRFPGAIPLSWVKCAIGLVLAPFCWITTEAALSSFARVTLQASFWRSQEFWFFSMGSLMWLIAFFGVKGRALLFLYVLGHECTHALFAVLCGGRVERLRVTSRGGHVLTDKNNVLISLSPYFVPFYTVLLIAGYAAIAHLLDLDERHHRALFALIGVTWTFHLTFTVWMILKNQPDLRQNGTFFSLTLIYLINLLIIVAMLIAGSPSLSWRDFTTTWLTQAYTLPARAAESVQEIVGN